MSGNTARGKRFLAVVAILLLLAMVFVFLAELGAKHLRNRRELAVYSTVLNAAAAYNVCPAMVLAVCRTESDFRENALSPAGAVGLMQILPETFCYLRDEHLHEDLPDSALYDPAVNIRYGTYYLSYLFERFGSWQVTLAAYNAGEGRVTEWLADKTLSDGKELISIPFEETEHYVAATLDAYRYYLEKYNFKE